MGHRQYLFTIGERCSDGGLEGGRFGCIFFGSFAEAVEEDLRQGWAAAFRFFFGFGRKEFALASHVGRGELESVEDDAVVIVSSQYSDKNKTKEVPNLKPNSIFTNALVPTGHFREDYFPKRMRYLR